MQHADDAGRALVASARCSAEPLDERRVGRDAGDRDGARVRDVGQQRAERHDHLDAERLGEVDHRARRTCASASPARGRRAGSGRAARAGRGPRRSRTPATSIVRETPSTRRTIGRVDWKSTNSSGSIVAKRLRRRARAEERSAAEVADSPASFQPLNAQTSAGARRPSGRRSQRSGCIRLHRTASRPVAQSERSPRTAPSDRLPARRRRGRRRLRLHAQGPAASRARARRTSRSSCATAPARCPARAFRDADVLAGRFERGDLVRVRGRVERFRDELQVEVRAIARARGRPTRRRSCPSPTATSTSSTASSSTSRARSTTRRYAGCWSDCSADDALRAELAPRAVHARAATTPTSAGCSSTRSRSATLALEACTAAPAAELRTCCSARRSCTTSARRASSRYGAEIGLTEEGRLLGPRRSSACGCSTSARRGCAEDRRLALAHCVLAHHGPDGRAGPALRLRRGARAVPAQRARRERQGRARARPVRSAPCPPLSSPPSCGL